MNKLPVMVMEIGLNGNGHVELVKKTIDACMAQVGSYPKDLIYFKFQKREPDVSTPKHMWNTRRVSPKSGEEMSYYEYRKEMEFSTGDYHEIMAHASRYLGRNHVFVSVWDMESVDWVYEHFPQMRYVKLPSVHLGHEKLISYTAQKFRDIILSTGGSYQLQVERALDLVKYPTKLTVLACTSTYPCPDEEVNLTKMQTLKRMILNYGGWDRSEVGFSSHSSGILPALMAAALGAQMIEFHVTYDRTLPGSDHAASVEGGRIGLIFREVGRMPTILGNGKIEPSSSELEKLRTLR